MVGHRFIEDLLDKYDASLFDITVFAKNPVKPMTVSTCHPTSLTTPRKSSLVREGFTKHGVKVLVGERARITITVRESDSLQREDVRLL